MYLEAVGKHVSKAEEIHGSHWAALALREPQVQHPGGMVVVPL